MRTSGWSLALAGVALVLAPHAGAQPDTHRQAVELLEKVDRAARSEEALTVELFISENFGDQKVMRQATVYSAENDAALVMLFTEPKTAAGSGYLRVENNLWSYDPALGKWQRRTDRERLSGTNLQTSDLSVAPLGRQYDPTWDGEERSGPLRLRRLVLQAKKGVQVLYPKVRIWVDDDHLERKREEYAESGKLLRTSYVTKVGKVFSKKQNREVTLSAEVHVVDAVDKNRKTVIVFRQPVLGQVPQNVFSKAWLESKSR